MINKTKENTSYNFVKGEKWLRFNTFWSVLSATTTTLDVPIFSSSNSSSNINDSRSSGTYLNSTC